MGGEEALEEEGGGDLVDDGGAVDAGGVAGGPGGVAGVVEEGVGIVGGEAFVEEVEGEVGVGLAGEVFEGLGEGEGFDGLWAGGAVGVERVADEDGFDFVLADEAGDGFEVGAEVGAVEGEEGLRGETEGVGDGDADAAVADI